MSRQTHSAKPDRSDTSVLRTFALLIGVVLFVGGLAAIMNTWWRSGVDFAVRLDALTVAAAAAVVFGAVLVYWGVRRRGANTSEAALAKLVRKYERQGKTRELEEARERLIQLLVEKDEPESSAPK